MHEVFENPILHGRKHDGAASAEDCLFAGVKLQIADAKGGSCDSFAASNERFTAGDQLSEIEGFVEIVVGAVVEELDNGGSLAAGCKYKHCSVIATGADAAKDG